MTCLMPEGIYELDEQAREIAGLFNGAVWRAEWPLCWTVVIVYVPWGRDTDRWCTMGLDRSHRGGRYALHLHHGSDGSSTFTLRELHERLRERWKFMPNMTLAPLSEELFV